MCVFILSYCVLYVRDMLAGNQAFSFSSCTYQSYICSFIHSFIQYAGTIASVLKSAAAPNAPPAAQQLACRVAVNAFKQPDLRNWAAGERVGVLDSQAGAASSSNKVRQWGCLIFCQAQYGTHRHILRVHSSCQRRDPLFNHTSIACPHRTSVSATPPCCLAVVSLCVYSP